MKLSDYKGERAVEVIADLIEPITNIAADQKNLKLFQNQRRDGESDAELGAREIKEKIPNLLKTHKQDVLAILCIINEKDPDDFSLVDIIKGIMELLRDEDFKSLFLSVNKKADGKQLTEFSDSAEHSEPE